MCNAFHQAHEEIKSKVSENKHVPWYANSAKEHSYHTFMMLSEWTRMSGVPYIQTSSNYQQLLQSFGWLSHFQSMGLTYFIHFCQLLKIIPLKLPLLSYILFSWIPFACSLFNSYNTAFNDCRSLSENHVPSSFNTSIRIQSFFKW